MTYTECIDFINSFTKSGKPQNKLDRFENLAEKLGNPHKDIKFIHVAGTNGKGSVCEYISNALVNNGFKVGKFTSPFIIDLTERIQINNANISHTDLAELCDIVKKAIDSDKAQDYSQFEIFTAAAFLYFRNENVDYVVLETGIGGLLDCTNIVTPEISVITSIDFDHTNILGSTISEIAAHKAGIIKPNRPVFSAPFQHEDAVSVLTETARLNNSRLVFADGNELTIHKNSIYGTEFSYKGSLYRTKMGGKHQPINASLAIEVLEFMKIPEKCISKSLENSQLLARLEVLDADIPIIADGGHNPSGTLMACDLIKEAYLSPVLICGMLSTKDFEATLINLLRIAKHAIFVDSFSALAVNSKALARFAEGHGVKAYICENEKDSVKKAMELYNSEKDVDSILICGSLYLAGLFCGGALGTSACSAVNGK